MPKGTYKFPGVIIYGLVAFFEAIKFFENGNGEDNVVFFKLIYAGTVVENYVGIEDKKFAFLIHINPGMLMREVMGKYLSR